MELNIDKHEMALSGEEQIHMPEPANLLEGMKIIVKYSENSALCDTYFENVKVPMAYLCRRLSLTPTQVTLLAIIMEFGCQMYVFIGRIARHLDISNLDMLSRSADLTTLITRRLITENRKERETRYTVPREVYDAFKRNEVYDFKLPRLRNDEELANQLDKMLLNLGERESEKELEFFDSDLRDLLHANAHIRLARTLLSVFKQTTEAEFRVVVLMSMIWIRDEETVVDGNNFRVGFSRKFETRQMINQLQSGRSILVKKGIIKVASNDGLMSVGAFSLTSKFQKALTPDRITNKEAEEWCKLLTRHTNIQQKELFYNPEAEAEIRRLQQLLQPEQMSDVLARMKEKGLRSGFTCLLYGGPGTGKTETVLQLARSCERDIFQVDVSKLRSKWYGESEKIVKGVFDEYRRMVKHSKVAPILFFNEADAIFNRRMENAERSTDKGENALQNIILQEMENLDGILIATTHLQDNLDAAFERRFLYKLVLDKPTTEVKARIWQSMLPDLSEKEAKTLAYKFDFSGGEIENVVRKGFIDEVMTGEKTSLNALLTLCQNEMLNNKRAQVVGFVNHGGQ